MLETERLRMAQQLKKNQLLNEAWEKVEKDCFIAFKASKTADEREALHATLTALTNLRSTLNGIIERTLRDGREQSADE